MKSPVRSGRNLRDRIGSDIWKAVLPVCFHLAVGLRPTCVCGDSEKPIMTLVQRVLVLRPAFKLAKRRAANLANTGNPVMDRDRIGSQ